MISWERSTNVMRLLGAFTSEAAVIERWLVVAVFLGLVMPCVAQEKEAQRLTDSYRVLHDLGMADKGIPHDLLNKAERQVMTPRQ